MAGVHNVGSIAERCCLHLPFWWPLKPCSCPKLASSPPVHIFMPHSRVPVNKMLLWLLSIVEMFHYVLLLCSVLQQIRTSPPTHYPLPFLFKGCDKPPRFIHLENGNSCLPEHWEIWVPLAISQSDKWQALDYVPSSMQSKWALLHCHPWCVWLYQIFLHHLINAKFSEKKVIEHKMHVMIFSTTFVWNISDSKNNSVRYCKI
jgi:hypothetical protein